MEKNNNLQLLLFEHIKSALPTHLSMVDEVAELLDISIDSTYRRIRGEKILTIDEIHKLASHFKISIDKWLTLETESILFSGKLIDTSHHLFENWMEDILQQLLFINSFEQKHMYYVAKDLPIMIQFLLPELIAFKAFYWKKSILYEPSLREQKFSLKEADPSHLTLGKKIVETYNKIPSSEIWNIESINSTIRQIEFYRDTNLFDSDADLLGLYKAIETIINHLELQAEFGLKFEISSQPSTHEVPYHLYNNMLELGDNTVLAVLDNSKITFLSHSVINFIATRDHRFNEYIFNSIETSMKKSSQISIIAEKERRRFFNRIRAKLNHAIRL